MQQVPQDSFQNLTGDLKTFYDRHGVQLLGMQFPGSIELLGLLKEKLEKGIFDAGEYFGIVDDQEQESFVVQASQNMKAFSNVFLIDHAMSFKYSDMEKIMKQSAGVLERLENMTKYWKEKKAIAGVTAKKDVAHERAVEFDEMQIVDPRGLKIAEDCVTLSLYSNDIASLEHVREVLARLPKLKVLWLNQNPVEGEALWSMVESEFAHVEMLNSRFTRNAGEWAFKFTTTGFDLRQCEKPSGEFRHLDVSGREVLRVADLSKKLQAFKRLRQLSIKDTQVSDLEHVNRLLAVLHDNRIKRLGCDEEVEDMLHELHKSGKLRNVAPHLELVNGRDITHVNYHPAQRRAQRIRDSLFRVANCYRLLSSDQMDEQSIWYVMDELGTSIQHSDHANVMVMPLLYLPNGVIDQATISYSLLWPIQDLTSTQPIFRDYLVGINEDKNRSCRLSVWFDIPFDLFTTAYDKYRHNLCTRQKAVLGENEGEVKFLESSKSVKMLTDHELISEYVTLPYVEFTKELEECELIFFCQSVHDDIAKFQGKWINQFPEEMVLVSKDHLAAVVQYSQGAVPWLQETFNLQTQLALFMGAFRRREEAQRNNVWIIKPPNMARSLDTVVTDNLDLVLRLLETGPKIAQKYIQRPLTLRGKKVDFRFIVALRSLIPLEVFIYKVFWIRISNVDYTLDVNSFLNYETHFTVMNYGHQLTQIHYDQFIQEFENENPIKWDQVHHKINQMVKELFVGIKQTRSDMHQPLSRAIYGMDVMIEMPEYQPKLLEMTFSPDCYRACKYHPSFYNDIIECLFFGKENANMMRIV